MEEHGEGHWLVLKVDGENPDKEAELYRELLSVGLRPAVIGVGGIPTPELQHGLQRYWGFASIKRYIDELRKKQSASS